MSLQNCQTEQAGCHLQPKEQTIVFSSWVHRIQAKFYCKASLLHLLCRLHSYQICIPEVFSLFSKTKSSLKCVQSNAPVRGALAVLGCTRRPHWRCDRTNFKSLPVSSSHGWSHKSLLMVLCEIFVKKINTRWEKLHIHTETPMFSRYFLKKQNL